MKKYIIILFLICLNTSIRAEGLQYKIEKLFEKLTQADLFGDAKDDGSVNEKLKLYEEKLNIALQSKDDNKIAESYYNVAWTHFYVADFDKALENYLNVTKYNGDLYYRINAYGIASNIYSWTGRKEEGFEHAQKALQLAQISGDNALMGYAMLYMGDAYNYSGQIALAKENYVSATEYFTKASDEGKIQIPTSAALLQLVNMDVDIQSTLKYTFLVKYLYDTGNKYDKEIFSLSLFKSLYSFMELRKLEYQREQRIWIYTSAAILLIVIAVFLFLQNVSRKKMNLKLRELNIQLAEQNNTKVKILGILNHDLRRPVAQWVNFLELRQRAPEDITPELENKSLSASLNLLYNVEELLVWSKDQMYENEKVETDIEISELFGNIKTFFRYENGIQLIFNNPDNLIIRTQKDHLTIIMRNLTSNAVNALREEENPFIEWTATKEQNNVVLSIRDNGCGIFGNNPIENGDWVEMSPQNGLGLQIVQDLAQKINCSIEVKQGEPKGTIFKLTIKNSSI